MGRKIAVAALGAFCLAAGALAGEYEFFTDEALGVKFDLPPGYEVGTAPPAEGEAANALYLDWPEGPCAGLEVLITRREAEFANVVTWAGFWQRRRGASASFEAEGELLGEGELAAAAAEEGLRASYIIGEQDNSRNLETLILKSEKNIYVVEVSYPELSGANITAAAQGILRTFKISPPPAAEEEAEASGGADVETEPPSE